jgi:hypothetical protein
MCFPFVAFLAWHSRYDTPYILLIVIVFYSSDQGAGQQAHVVD